MEIINYVFSIELESGSVLSSTASFPKEQHATVVETLDELIAACASGDIPLLEIGSAGVILNRQALINAKYSYSWQ
jgi:hypothetical protein